jgi:two-component system phosphate regulon sensor histidine kinase PhoR
MEKRIKFVWILSLLSALLVIGVQWYWVYNQYLHVIDTYCEEIAGLTLQAGDEEYKLRKSDKPAMSYIVQKKLTHRNDETGDVSNLDLSLSIGKMDTLKIDSLARPPVTRMYTGLDSLVKAQNNESRIYFYFDGSMPDDALHVGLNRAMTENFSIPFDRTRLDSLLSVFIPDISYSIMPWEEAGAYRSHWEKTGGLLHPKLDVRYAYSPLEQKGVIIRIAVPSQPLFKRMAVQLILASGLILLLTCCLVFQINTILRQQKLGEQRENFVNTMIHELKRPVQTLKTFVAFLGDREMRTDEVTTRQVAQDSMFELDNLSAYLNKLRDMLRTDNEATPLHITRFDLRELMEKVARLTPVPAGKTVKLSTVCEPETLWVEADPVHLANILSNLIENAVKYSGQEVSIELKAVRKDRELRLSVTDNGIGISPAEQKKVFMKFYRGTNLPDKNIPGLGLGLCYVKLIAEAHQGKVSLHSCSGKGTVLTLCLPQ